MRTREEVVESVEGVFRECTDHDRTVDEESSGFDCDSY